jgi:DNA-binding transcriptional LysR family regulator
MAIRQRGRSNPERLDRHEMDRPLDTVTLQFIVAVCEEGSIARAAAREAIVPSALSKRIAALERELGVSLFVRQRRGVQPTPAGEALLRQARELFSTLDRLRADIGGYGTGVQGSVQVLASPSALAERLPDDIAAFLARHPRIRVGLDERMSPDIVRAVRDGAADLGVLWDLADLAGLQVLPYREDHLCVALPPHHALARRPHLRLADTLDHVSIGVAPES